MHNQIEIAPSGAMEMPGIEGLMDELGLMEGCLDCIDMSEIMNIADEQNILESLIPPPQDATSDHNYELKVHDSFLEGKMIDSSDSNYDSAFLGNNVDAYDQAIEDRKSNIYDENNILFNFNNNNNSNLNNDNMCHNSFVKLENIDPSFPNYTNPQSYFKNDECEYFPYTSGPYISSTDDKESLKKEIFDKNPLNSDLTETNLGKVLTVCKQYDLKTNPHFWSSSDVTKWMGWVKSKCHKKLAAHKDLFNNDRIKGNKENARKAKVKSIHENTDNSVENKSYNINGERLCRMSRQEIASEWPGFEDSVTMELEQWKNVGYLLDSLNSNKHLNYSSAFDTPLMSNEHDQLYFNSSSIPTESVKAPIRPSNLPFFSSSQLTTTSDPILSQPSFFLSPPPVEEHIQEYFFPSSLDITPTSFSSPSSLSPSSLYLDFYESSFNHSNETPHETTTHTTRQGNQLWQFLKELLMQPKVYENCIKWLDKQQGIFKIEDSIKVAKLWGERKNRPAMNYDKLSRSIRQYYRKGIIKKTTQSKRLVYQFCQKYL